MIESDKFIDLMEALFLSKFIEFDREKYKRLLRVYWHDLKNLEFIEIILNNARKKSYKRSMPSINELVEDHKNYAKEQKKYEPKQIEGIKLSREKMQMLNDNFKKMIHKLNVFFTGGLL